MFLIQNFSLAAFISSNGFNLCKEKTIAVLTANKQLQSWYI